METQYISNFGIKTEVPQIKIRYVLYARKSTESEEQQILSIDSQIKEMIQMAERENLEIVEIKKEAHSAKESGQRPVFLEILSGIKENKFNGIITWAPDRLSRNAGDLGSLVDLMDQKKLIEIKTFGQKFTNSPSEKFLLMILCSQAKLENDNKSINVKRGLRTRCEMGLWPAQAPIGYLSEKRTDKKCEVKIDKERSLVIKKMFEKVAYEKYSGKKIHEWLKNNTQFKSTSGKQSLSLGNIFLILRNTFYYGEFEFPKGSNNWYKGKHDPIISKELFNLAQLNIKEHIIKSNTKEFAFTKLMTCGLCGSGITADEKFKKQKNGNVNKYIYYGCTKVRDKNCKCGYLNEIDLINQFIENAESLDIDEKLMSSRIKEDIKRFKKLQTLFLGIKSSVDTSMLDIKGYMKFTLTDGSITEKRDILRCIKNKVFLKNKSILLG
jgi:site-specific DNA recombinase